MNQPATTRFVYGYHGSREYGTYFDCIVTDTLIDGKLVIVDQAGEQLIIEPWAFTKTGEVEVDLSEVERFNVVPLCADYLAMHCHGCENPVQALAEETAKLEAEEKQNAGRMAEDLI